MSIEIADITYDQVRYDATGDVLYLHRGDSATAVDFDATPEGHHLRFDEHGDLVGVTILNARWLFEREGQITLTISGPDASHLVPEQVRDAFAAA
jgi:uncharacterized protein YuzE